jgi:hypothetical protein
MRPGKRRRCFEKCAETIALLDSTNPLTRTHLHKGTDLLRRTGPSAPLMKALSIWSRRSGHLAFETQKVGIISQQPGAAHRLNVRRKLRLTSRPFTRDITKFRARNPTSSLLRDSSNRSVFACREKRRERKGQITPFRPLTAADFKRDQIANCIHKLKKAALDHPASRETMRQTGVTRVASKRKTRLCDVAPGNSLKDRSGY